jgi:cysteine sulfinate desulfinase/cysteine desulfurase-like protein
MAAAADAVELDEAGMRTKRDRFENAIVEGTHAQVLGTEYPRLANTSAVIIDGIDGREFVAAMDEHQIAVSAGAACHALSGGGSPSGQVRFSMGHQTTETELSEAVKMTVEVVSKLRKKQ